MSIALREGDFQALFQAPFACYGKDAFIASPLEGDLRRVLDARRNPLFRHYARRTWFTAHRDGRIVGRILASIHDAGNRLHGTRRGQFGLFDCVDDAQVAGTLLGAAADWLRERDCDDIAGPFDLTITQVIGAVTDGFEHQPYAYQGWSPPHVARLLQAHGFERFYPMRTFEVDLATADPGRLAGPAQRALLSNRDWSFEPLRRFGLGRSLREACAVLNDGFARNPMFVPLADEEFLFASAGMALVMDGAISCIARHRGHPAGIVLCLPDLNPMLHASGYRLGWRTPAAWWRHARRNRRAAAVFYSVRHEHHGQGVNGAMLHRVLTAMRARGYQTLGVSWISDGNGASLRQMEKLSARPLHRLHLFRKAL